MNPNTDYQIANATYVQKMQPIDLDEEPVQLEWPFRLAAALLHGLWNLVTALVKRGDDKQPATLPTLERAVN
jgi:hypothetical protein